MCEIASWIPNAVAVKLRAETAQPVIEWLTTIRQAIEEYDPLITVAPPDDEPETPDNKFDEILSQLGKEIYKLDEYQRNLAPSEKEVSLSILNIFDECLDRMAEEKSIKNSESDCESTLSDVSFVTSTPADKVNNINKIVDSGDGTPVPTIRTRLKSICSNSISDMESDVRCDVTDSDSVSTCWSYKECSTDENDVNPYSAVWAHSTGFHNSDEILRIVLSQHHATISRLSFDTAGEFIPDSYSVYSLHEVGECKDRCVDSGSVAMTPDKPTDDGYEPVRDAITDENIYEEIEYGYTDEGCSCGGSVEVESCSISASSEGVGRESPLYVNLRDNDAYAIPPDVVYWKNLLLDPFYNDDEEDEWITPEECEVYARDHRPTAPVIQCVIPRITQYRTPRVRQQTVGSTYHEENIPEQGLLKSRGYENDWSPTSERCRLDLDMGYSKSSSDSPPVMRINKRLGGSTENLLGNIRRPFHLQLPASSSGDSLDVEFRDREPVYARNRKSRSMVAPKHRLKSPVPAPRLTLQQHPEIIMEGPAKRTKFLEGAKKTKKNWIDCYMVLTSTALVFYKDQKSIYVPKVSRPPGSPPSPSAPQKELTLSLCNARADECPQKYTKRYQRSILLFVGCDQYLIQDDTESGAKKWLEEINKVIYNVFPWSQKGDNPPSAYQSSNTDQESLGRTPPAARHITRTKQKAGGSSIEDLSDSADAIQRSHVKSRLKKFFAKRPAMEHLVRKGIYKDEPVFGRSLEEVCPPPSSPCRVPEFVVACIKEIEKDENMCTDGLYRASGNLSQVQKIRLEVDQNNMSVIASNSDIHVLTGSLKLFFRELKEPLIPWSIFDRVLAACSIKPREARIKEFQSIVQALPQCNRDTLKYLLEHLLRVIKCSEKNRMHTGNLAIVFGPTLLWAPADKANYNIAVDCIQQNYVVEIFLTDFNEIFADNTNVGR